jgi:hypothetical protein
MMNTERGVRNYALHLAMQVRRRGRELWLEERYGGNRQKFGAEKQAIRSENPLYNIAGRAAA